MAATLSRKDVEDIKPYLDKTVQKFLGFREPSLVMTAVNCLSSGYDKRKTAEKLTSLLDQHKAAKLADRIFDIVEEIKTSTRNSRKRHRDDERDDNKEVRKKVAVEEDIRVPEPGKPSPGQLTTIQIKEMMANAQRMIQERKRALNVIEQQDYQQATEMAHAALSGTGGGSASAILAAAASQGLYKQGQGFDFEKARKIAELQAQIQSKLSSGVLGFGPPKGPSKPTPLILDDEGRTVDLSGKEIQLTQRMPTLKANIRAKKREEFRLQLADRVVEDLSETKYFDHRVTIKPPVRMRRSLKFNEPGKFQQLAVRLRMKSQLERLQNEISQIARKTGISSATKLALIAPKAVLKEDDIPDVEWWDSVIIPGDRYEFQNERALIRASAITHLVEHPTQMRCPTDPLKPVYMPVFLTKKERKKLRRQNRREAWKEKQEKIRLGLEPPPEPKLRMSNLMRVLGTEAVQDPTKIEAHVREQMARRRKAHEEANAARKLTTEQRRDKKIKKMQEDTSLGVNVSVYRISDMSNPSKKFKVETNAKQLFMTGCVVLFKDCNVVVVEAGPKQQKKYRRLMLNRIKWEEDTVKDKDGNDAENKCVLVWEGSVKQRVFDDIKFKSCPTESFAREHFRKLGVEHYWDLAYSGTVLEVTEDV